MKVYISDHRQACFDGPCRHSTDPERHLRVLPAIDAEVVEVSAPEPVEGYELFPDSPGALLDKVHEVLFDGDPDRPYAVVLAEVRSVMSAWK